MQRRFSVDRNKQEHLEDEFMNYIDSVFNPHPVHPYTLLRGYNSFMRDYIGYIDDTTPSSNSLTLTPQNMERLYFAFEAERKVRLSEEEKKALRSFSKYQEEIEKMSVYEIVSFLFQKSFQKKDLDDMSIIVIKVVNRN